jgi:TolB-like protein/AraC-like DNA-binding protein/Tfp pilus assembly protein PilF
MTVVSSMDHLIIMKLTEIIHSNLENEDFGVNELAHSAGMSRSSLHRKMQSILKKSTSQFIREVRLQRAMDMLLHDVATASEISFKVGFNSPTYFNTCFHHYFGYPPGEVKRRNFTEPDQLNSHVTLVPGHSIGELMAKEQNEFPQRQSGRNKFLNATVAILLSFFLFYFLYATFIKEATVLFPGTLKPHEKSIAVLPFKNLSDNSENQYFADGVMEDILNHLFRIKELKVISRATGEFYRGKGMSVPQIAKKLGVNFILEGSVQQYEGKVRVIVQLIDARQDKHIWSEKYDRELSNIFVIQSSIAKQIADELQTVLSSNEIKYIEKIPTNNPEAYNYYLKGRFYLNTRNEYGLKQSVEYFERALTADPDYALAYTGLADAYFAQARRGWIPMTLGYGLAKEMVTCAIDRDKSLGEAHATMGALLCWSEWKWEEAQKEFVLAVELNPNYSVAHQYYSEFLDIFGKNSEARMHINYALQLDPFSPQIYLLSALYFYNEGKMAESLDECRKALRIDPDFVLVHWRSFLIFLRQGENLKAVETLQKIMAIDTSTLNYIRIVKDVYESSGKNGLLNWLIVLELKKTEPEFLMLARLNALLGENAEALKCLDKAFHQRLPGLPGILNDADFKNLRNIAAYHRILNKIGLPD